MLYLNRLKPVAAIAIFASFSVGAWADAPEYVEMALGNEDAEVVVTEYASFTCPHCATFHKDAFRKLKSDYIDTGKILFRFREVYFDHYGLWAGIVARCGDGSKYFGIVDILFDKQESWSRNSSPSQVAARLRGIGLAAGLTEEQLEVCLTDEANAVMLSDAYEDFRTEDNVTSTPSFVINGELHSNMPYEELAELLDAALAE